MAYIKPNEREQYADAIARLSAQLRVNNPGHLNYVISKLVHGFLPPQPYYVDLNEVIGVLECAKQELLRTVVGPYEENKRKLNGNISDLDKDS